MNGWTAYSCEMPMWKPCSMISTHTPLSHLIPSMDSCSFFVAHVVTLPTRLREIYKGDRPCRHYKDSPNIVLFNPTKLESNSFNTIFYFHCSSFNFVHTAFLSIRDFLCLRLCCPLQHSYFQPNIGEPKLCSSHVKAVYQSCGYE